MAGDLGDFLDEDHAAIVSFAETYMDDDERDDFVDTLMERRGYQRISSWGPGEPPKPAGRGGGGGRSGGGQRGGAQGGQRRPSYFKR